MNPCPCGRARARRLRLHPARGPRATSRASPGRCSTASTSRSRSRPCTYAEMMGPPGEASVAVARPGRGGAPRDRPSARPGTGVSLNADLATRILREVARCSMRRGCRAAARGDGALRAVRPRPRSGPARGAHAGRSRRLRRRVWPATSPRLFSSGVVPPYARLRSHTHRELASHILQHFGFWVDALQSRVLASGSSLWVGGLRRPVLVW